MKVTLLAIKREFKESLQLTSLGLFIIVLVIGAIGVLSAVGWCIIWVVRHSPHALLGSVILIVISAYFLGRFANDNI